MGDEEEIIKLLNNEPCSASACIVGTGNFGDASMSLAILSKLEFIRITVEAIESNLKVKHVETLIWAKSQDIYHPENSIIKPHIDLNGKKAELKTTPAKTEEVSIDETDKQIVRILANSSRKSFSWLAQELGISTHNVINRYRKLRGGGVITRAAISVNLNKVGYRACTTNLLRFEIKSKVSEIRQQLLQIPNTIVLIEHAGTYDLRIDIPIAGIADIFYTRTKSRNKRHRDRRHRNYEVPKTIPLATIYQDSLELKQQPIRPSDKKLLLLSMHLLASAL